MKNKKSNPWLALAASSAVVFALAAGFYLLDGNLDFTSSQKQSASLAPKNSPRQIKPNPDTIKILGEENSIQETTNITQPEKPSVFQSLDFCDNCITAENIKNQTITGRKIKDGSIDTKQLDGGITLSRLNLGYLNISDNPNRKPGHFSLHQGDAYISGRLEVDKEAYFDSTLYVKDATSISTLNSTTLQTDTANISNILSNSNLHIKGRLPDQDTFHLHDFTDAFIYPSSLTVIGYESLNVFTPDHLNTAEKKQNSLYIKNNLEVGGTIYGNIEGSITTDSVDLATLTAETANITAIDLGTNTISDQNLTGNWSFNGGTITNAVWNGATISDSYIANDITLSNITQITSRSHTNLSDIGTNTHAQIDSHLSNTSNPHGVTKTQVGLGSVENTTLSTWAGTTNITTLGAIATGSWTASPIADSYLAAISGNKVSGNISGAAASITGNLPFSQLTNPTADTSFSMQGYKATFTFGDNTGANNLFTVQDSASNTGTGYLLNIATGEFSLLNPLKVSASDGTFTAIAVNSSGQVGIGTSDQSSQLSIVGGATIGATFASSTLTDGILAVENSLGIGTDNPITPLEIYSINDPQLQISYDGATSLTFHLDADGNVSFETTGDQFTFNKPIETAGYRETCPEGYIWVPGSAKYGTLPGFCVMKYEAKNDGSSNPISQPTSTPWVSISQETARSECQSLGLGYHLISEAEWLTIAENITLTPINDLDDDGGLQLATGHTDNAPGSSLATTAAADPITTACNLDQTLEHADNTYDANDCEVRGDGSYGSDDSDKGYYGTGQNWSSSGYSSGAANKSQNRVHVLSNANTVWDIAGNVWEWTDALIMQTEQPTDGSEVGAGSGEWIEWNVAQKLQSTVSNSRPPLDDWTGSNGIGRLYTYGQDETSATMRAFMRGGYWNDTSNAGAWTLTLGAAPTNTGTNIGFRCALRQ